MMNRPVAAGRPGRLLAVAVVLIALLAPLFSPATVGAAPGGANFVVFWPNLSNPQAGTLEVYIGGTKYYSFVAGSGTSSVANNTPCNKYWGAGSGDTNGGGRSPGFTAAGQPWLYDSPAPGWTQGAAPYGNGLKMSDSTAYGYWYGTSHDCTGPYGGSIGRNGLWIHKTNGSGTGNYITQGCIKINGSNMSTLDAVYHLPYLWNGYDWYPYSDTVLVWG